jgi:hypothetical protein
MGDSKVFSLSFGEGCYEIRLSYLPRLGGLVGLGCFEFTTTKPF